LSGIAQEEETDEHGKVRARLGLAAEGSPVLRLLDADGELKALVGIAHPDFREGLERQAYEHRLIPRGVSF
jgi:hypothetical protein